MRAWISFEISVLSQRLEQPSLEAWSRQEFEQFSITPSSILRGFLNVALQSVGY
jgi:hypothetical protein